MSIIARIVHEVGSDLKQMAGLLQPPSRSRFFAQQRANQIRGIDNKNLTLRNCIRQIIGKACELYSKGLQIPKVLKSVNKDRAIRKGTDLISWLLSWKVRKTGP